MSHRWMALLTIIIAAGLLLPSCGSSIDPTRAPTPAGSAGPIDQAVARPVSSPPAPTLMPTAAPSPTPTATYTPTPEPTATFTPTPTPVPGAALVAFDTNRDGNAEVYLLDTKTGEQTNLTRHPAEDRAPAWRPDGAALAFESHRDGNWEVYVLDLATGNLARLTDHPAYDGAPAWSPDGSRLAFESYRDGNLEIYVVDAPAAPAGTVEAAPRRLTQNDAGDFGPAWSPDGQVIAFTSWRDGNKEIYLISPEGGEPRNLTQNPGDDEDPAWSSDGQALAFCSWRDVDRKSGSRDANIYVQPATGGPAERLTDNPWPDREPAWDAAGRLTWSAYDPGPAFETYDPYRPGSYHLYRQEADAPARLTDSAWDDCHPAPAPERVVSLERLALLLPPLPPTPTPEVTATLAPGALVPVVEAPEILAAGEPVLANALVVPSLLAWRQDVLQASGYDFLHNTLGTWRGIAQVRQRPLYAYDYGYLSWHKTGRALDLALEFKVDGADQLVKVRDDLGPVVHWRLYIRAARQDGSLGEPLKDNPWQYWWHIVPAEDQQAYDAGGRRVKIPAGYFVDITGLAARRSWRRIAAYAIPDDYHWRSDSNATEYWHYERTDGLVWWDAMRQIYAPDVLEQYVGWRAALDKAQSRAMLQSKGIPEP